MITAWGGATVWEIGLETKITVLEMAWVLAGDAEVLGKRTSFLLKLFTPNPV